LRNSLANEAVICVFMTECLGVTHARINPKKNAVHWGSGTRGTATDVCCAAAIVVFGADGGSERTYHIRFGLRLKGDFDRTTLSRALDRIVIRHESLRTIFAFIDEQPVQRIGSEEDSRFHLIEHDLRERGAAQAELDRLTAVEASTSTSLRRLPRSTRDRYRVNGVFASSS
jgi:hypothetical protein